MVVSPARPRASRARRFLLPSLVLSTLLLPGSGEAQPVVTTTSTSPQYTRPVSRTPLPKQYTGQPAKVFNTIIPPAAPIASCPPPTSAQCKSTTYLFTGCGQAHQKTCQGLLKNEYVAYYNALPGPANRQMFPYGTRAQFSDLKSGKFHGTVPTSPIMVRSKSFWDQTRILNAPPSANPKTYVPHPDWEADGAAVKTCEEYAYEKYYDWQRFQDGVTLCKGDYICAYEVAYVLNGPPGIAKRTLKRKDGADLAGQVKPAMPTPKNVFFTMGPYVTTMPTGVGKDGKPRSFLGFMPFADLKTKFPQFSADLDQLKVALDDGAVFYGTTGGGGVNAVYPNKWDFHSAMRSKTANVTENEFEEFERRRGELEFYVASIRPVDSGGGGGHFGLREAEFVHPLDEVSQVMTYDPWERADMFQDESVRTNVLANAQLGAIQQNHAALFGPNGAALKAPGSSVLRSGGGTMIQTGAGNGATAGNGRPAAVAGLNKVIKAKAPSTMTFMGPQIDCDDPSINVPPMDVEACEANATNCKGLAGPDAMRNQNQANWNYYAKCKITNLTLVEWWRRKSGLAQGCNDRGSCGCLDLTTSACDWSPKMFYDAYIAQPPGLSVATYQDGNLSKPADMSYLRDADYDNCKAWTYKGFGESAADRASGDALEAYLQRKREEVEKALKNIPQKKNGTQVIPGVLGQDFSDGAQEGDTDSWSAGYSMNAGWELKAAEFKPKTATEAKKTCQLQGNANASFTVKITTPIDGVLGDNFARLWNHAVDADVWVRANENKDQKVRYETHLLIADQQIFAEPKPYDRYKKFKDGATGASFNLNKSFNKPLVENTKKTSKLTLTVWAGPIPITGSVWAELSYGADAIAKGAMGSGCNVDMSTFEAKAGFEPYFNLSGALSLGVGIGGIVSAGIRGYLTLIDARLPIEARSWLSGAGASRKLNFGVDAALNLSSLGGRLSLYVEFLLYEEEWELFHWRGVHTTIPILKAVNEKFDFGALAAITP
jgi:hypothetical protein